VESVPDNTDIHTQQAAGSVETTVDLSPTSQVDKADHLVRKSSATVNRLYSDILDVFFRDS